MDTHHRSPIREVPTDQLPLGRRPRSRLSTPGPVSGLPPARVRPSVDVRAQLRRPCGSRDLRPCQRLVLRTSSSHRVERGFLIPAAANCRGQILGEHLQNLLNYSCYENISSLSLNGYFLGFCKSVRYLVLWWLNSLIVRANSARCCVIGTFRACFKFCFWGIFSIHFLAQKLFSHKHVDRIWLQQNSFWQKVISRDVFRRFSEHFSYARISNRRRHVSLHRPKNAQQNPKVNFDLVSCYWETG